MSTLLNLLLLSFTSLGNVLSHTCVSWSCSRVLCILYFSLHLVTSFTSATICLMIWGTLLWVCLFSNKDWNCICSNNVDVRYSLNWHSMPHLSQLMHLHSSVRSIASKEVTITSHYVLERKTVFVPILLVPILIVPILLVPILLVLILLIPSIDSFVASLDALPGINQLGIREVMLEFGNLFSGSWTSVLVQYYI